jgi:hypothetical protein
MIKTFTDIKIMFQVIEMRRNIKCNFIKTLIVLWFLDWIIINFFKVILEYMNVFVQSSHEFKDSVAVDVSNFHSQQITKGHIRLFIILKPATSQVSFNGPKQIFWLGPRSFGMWHRIAGQSVPTSVERRLCFHFQGPRCPNIISSRDELFEFHKMRGISWVAENLLASQKDSMVLFS